MSDLISRAELFDRLATIAAPAEANDLKAKIYQVIQGMPEASRAYEEIPHDKEGCRSCRHYIDMKGCWKCGQGLEDNYVPIPLPDYSVEAEMAKSVMRLRWIPVSEMLPETHREEVEWLGNIEEFFLSDYVMVTGERKDPDLCDPQIFIAQYEVGSGGRTYWNDCFGGLLENVTAWRSLPDPYNGKE